MIARAVIVCSVVVSSLSGCGGAQVARSGETRTLALGLSASLPDTMGPMRWTLFVDRRRVWAGEVATEPLAVELGIASDARTVQLAGESDGTAHCASSYVHVELSRSLSADVRRARLNVELATDAGGVVRLRSDHDGMSHADDHDSSPAGAPPAGASDEQLADFMADLLIAARRSGDLTSVACVRRRVDEASALLQGRSVSTRASVAIGLDREASFQAPSQNARLRALASAAAHCPLHGYAPAMRSADSVEVAGPPRCGVRPAETRSSVDVEADSETRGAEQRYPRPLPDIPRRSGEDTTEVTVERVPP